VDFKWQDVKTADLLKLTRTEAQVRISLHCACVCVCARERVRVCVATASAAACGDGARGACTAASACPVRSEAAAHDRARSLR
jgi:hypothetical protein